MTRRSKRLGEMAADVSGATGDEDSRHGVACSIPGMSG